jgi:glycosyltransferase involved in cell wall biosynthesis
VVVAHDYTTQRGGAERVALNLLDAFPGSRLVTSVYAPERTFEAFQGHDVETLWPNRLPFLQRDPRKGLLVLAPAWSHHRVQDADVVICSSSGWAHGVTSDAPKIVYCYTPARWLYEPDDYLMSVSAPGRLALRSMSSWLKKWDASAAATCARYLTTSTVVAERIRRVYGIEAAIVPPPISLGPDGPQEPVPGVEPGYLLTVSRSRGYKNTQLVCSAVEGLPGERLVVTGRLPERPGGGTWDSRLTGVGFVSDAQLRWLYAHCRAVVSASYEDFGLTPLEGNAFGKPAALLRAGGFLDTLVDGVTGCYIEEATVEAAQDALASIPDVDAEAVRRHAEAYSRDAFAASMRQVVTEVLSDVRRS